MVDFDSNSVQEDINHSLTQLGQKVESLHQQLSDCTSQVTLLQGTLAEKGKELTDLQAMADEYEEDNQKLTQEAVQLREDNAALRRKTKNQQVDIDDLRQQREALQDLALDVSDYLGMLAALAEPETTDVALEPEEVAESDRGKYKGVFICCGNDHFLGQNQGKFLQLIDALPQIDWGQNPLYVLKDQQRPVIPSGLHLVAVFFSGMSHPDVWAIKKCAKLTGANVIAHAHLMPMVQLIRLWLTNPDFQAGAETHIGDRASVPVSSR